MILLILVIALCLFVLLGLDVLRSHKRGPLSEELDWLVKGREGR